MARTQISVLQLQTARQNIPAVLAQQQALLTLQVQPTFTAHTVAKAEFVCTNVCQIVQVKHAELPIVAEELVQPDPVLMPGKLVTITNAALPIAQINDV
jgi:hypothetical protein